jgi:hypothetical protein
MIAACTLIFLTAVATAVLLVATRRVAGGHRGDVARPPLLPWQSLTLCLVVVCFADIAFVWAASYLARDDTPARTLARYPLVLGFALFGGVLPACFCAPLTGLQRRSVWVGLLAHVVIVGVVVWHWYLREITFFPGA